MEQADEQRIADLIDSRTNRIVELYDQMHALECQHKDFLEQWDVLAEELNGLIKEACMEEIEEAWDKAKEKINVRQQYREAQREVLAQHSG